MQVSQFLQLISGASITYLHLNLREFGNISLTFEWEWRNSYFENLFKHQRAFQKTVCSPVYGQCPPQLASPIYNLITPVYSPLPNASFSRPIHRPQMTTVITFNNICYTEVELWKSSWNWVLFAKLFLKWRNCFLIFTHDFKFYIYLLGFIIFFWNLYCPWFTQYYTGLPEVPKMK